MKTNISNVVKMVNPNAPSKGGSGGGPSAGIQTSIFDEPENTDSDPTTSDGGEGAQKPYSNKEGNGQGSSADGDSGQSGDAPMVNTDNIDNIEKRTTVIRNDVVGGKGGGKVVGTGEVITKEQGRKIAESEGYEDKSTGNSEEDWKKLARTAAQTHLTKRNSSKGNGSGSIYQRIMELTDPIVDWRQELKKFIGKLASTTDFKFPSRRSIYSDEYRYSLQTTSNSLENGVVAIDVSGSVAAAFPEFAAEVVGIAKAKKIKTISVLPFANAVVDPFQITGFKKPTPEDFEHVRTGGGTEAIPDVIKWVHDKLKDRIDFCVIVTDGHLTNGLPPAPKWGKNTIWLVFDHREFDVPSNWGRVIHAQGDKRYF